MSDRLLVELGADGRVSVGQWLEGDLLPDVGAPSDLVWPLDEEALKDLRWYLEDYLRAPFGVYEDRGPQVEARLAGWGEALFSAVFGSGPARDAYVRIQARPGPVEVVFRSPSPALLGLPWELMRDPGRPTPLALDLALSRTLPVAESAVTLPVPGGRLRVLMVISRPKGARDVGYQMIARPLLSRLEAVRGQVDLVVLRPPTLETLAETLTAAADAEEPFQVVHFDGHGALATTQTAGAGGPWVLGRPGAEGVLVFEKPDGGPDEVPASGVAQVLKAARVPVMVLNACQSGAVGKDLEAAVATRLLQEGTASVVAMAYTVYAVAAAEFMAAFYERLFTGATVTAAVTAGRQRLFLRNLRPSPKGDMPLADWVVPVHYLRREVSFPQARTPRRPDKPSLDAALDRLRESEAAMGTAGGSLDPVGSFVGRDTLFFDLEAAARLQRVVVLHGPGGTGKTELAKAFGRWWRDTGGVDNPDWVFWHSFEPGVASFGLDGVITEIGLGVFGSDFAARTPDERRRVVEDLLAERRLLLVWDNFESVHSMPDPAQATPPLDAAGRQELKDFLGHVAGRGRSAVIITSRTHEEWLGSIRHIAVSGLAPHEAAEYAGNLLAPYPAALPRRAGRAFGELMEWLDGHPLSMRLILPYLQITEPAVLLDGLRGVVALPGGTDTAGGRTTSLTASITYSHGHLPAGTRRLLAAVSLCEGVADAGVLAVFSQIPGVPRRFRGSSRDDWLGALEAAARVGLLTPLGAGTYQIHPALPAYLAAQWAVHEPSGYLAMRDAAVGALLAAYAVGLSRWLSQQIWSGDAGLALGVVGLHRRTMGALLGYALDHQLWEQAQAIALPLDAYWAARGLGDEADAWADRVRLATENPDGTAPPLDTPAGVLWMFFTGQQAARQMESHHLDRAERTHRQILASLQTQPASSRMQMQLAVNYHALGNIAHLRRRLGDAENWYGKAFAIAEQLGQPRMATTICYQLGMTARERGRLDDAEGWYTKSLALAKELGDRSQMAATYHELGVLALLRERLDDAEDWYTKTLAIAEELGDRPQMARTYTDLGTAAQQRERLDDAEEWYAKSLAIKEDLGDRPGMASTCHGLGNNAYLRGRLADAKDWYDKSLAIETELGNQAGMARTLGQLGLLAEAGGQPSQALEWMVRSIALFPEFPHPATGPSPEHLAQLTAQLGISALETCWQAITGDPLPQVVRDYVDSPVHSGSA